MFYPTQSSIGHAAGVTQQGHTLLQMCPRGKETGIENIAETLPPVAALQKAQRTSEKVVGCECNGLHLAMGAGRGGYS